MPLSRSRTYTEERQAVLHKNGPGTEIGYRLAWARTYLREWQDTVMEPLLAGWG